MKPDSVGPSKPTLKTRLTVPEPHRPLWESDATNPIWTMTIPAISALTSIEQLAVLPPLAKTFVSAKPCQLHSQGLVGSLTQDPAPLTCPLLHSGDTVLGVGKDVPSVPSAQGGCWRVLASQACGDTMPVSGHRACSSSVWSSPFLPLLRTLVTGLRAYLGNPG